MEWGKMGGNLLKLLPELAERARSGQMGHRAVGFECRLGVKQGQAEDRSYRAL